MSPQRFCHALSHRVRKRGLASLPNRSGAAPTLSSLKAEFGCINGGHEASETTLRTLYAWHSAVHEVAAGTGDGRAHLEGVVAADAIFRPPTYFTPWKGREEMLTILECVGAVFGPEFKYGRQWLSDDGKDWALEFTAPVPEVKGKKMLLEGIDLVKLDDAGMIVDFAVLARPPNAVTSLKDAMMMKAGPKLAALKLKQTFGMA